MNEPFEYDTKDCQSLVTYISNEAVSVLNLIIPEAGELGLFPVFPEGIAKDLPEKKVLEDILRFGEANEIAVVLIDTALTVVFVAKTKDDKFIVTFAVTMTDAPENVALEVIERLAEAFTVPPLRAVPATIVLAEKIPLRYALPEVVSPIELADTVKVVANEFAKSETIVNTSSKESFDTSIIEMVFAIRFPCF